MVGPTYARQPMADGGLGLLLGLVVTLVTALLTRTTECAPPTLPGLGLRQTV